MASINQEYTSRSVQNVRVNDRVLEVCKKTGIPFTSIVENCLVRFATLPDEEKIEILTEYDPDKVDSSRIIDPGFNFADKAIEQAKQTLGPQANKTSTKMLLTIGLVLVAALFFSSKKKG